MSRNDAITRAFLRYLYEENHFRPAVEGFFASSHARAQRPPVTEQELVGVLSALRACKLIATSGETHTSVPARAGLTGSGLICAGHHGGDVSAWKRDQKPAAAGTREHPPAPREQPQEEISVVAPRQSPEPRHDYDGMTRVCRVLLLALPSVQPATGDFAFAAHAAEKLLAAIRSPRNDTHKISLLARNLRMELATGPLAGTLGAVLLDGFDEALREADLNSSA